MALGKKTGGRKKGTPNKKTEKQVQAVQESGLTPLEFMLQVMRDERKDDAERLDAAHKAAPYVHPKLAAIDHTGEIGVVINRNVIFEAHPDDADD